MPHGIPISLLKLAKPVIASELSEIYNFSFTSGIFPEELKLSRVIPLYKNESKGIDTINHTILLSKLEHYGIRGVALHWFRTYLTDLSQFIDFNGTLSNTIKTNCGVPQGSNLGPPLFLIYVNDISNCSNVLKLRYIRRRHTNAFLEDSNDTNFNHNG